MASEKTRITNRFYLTPRENEVMRSPANGRLYKETGQELGISFSAVHKHATNIFRKLHVGNRTEATMKWLNEVDEPKPRHMRSPVNGCFLSLCGAGVSLTLLLGSRSPALESPGGPSNGTESTLKRSEQVTIVRLPHQDASLETTNSRPANAAQAAQDSLDKEIAIRRAPAWVIPYGREFWRREINPAQPSRTEPGSASAMIPVNRDLGDVIDRVSHAITREGSPGVAGVQAETYSATFGGTGVRFSPDLPANRPVLAANDFPLEGLAPLPSMSGYGSRASSGGLEIDPEPPSLLNGAAPGGSRARFPLPDPATEVTLYTRSIRLGNEVVYAERDGRLTWSLQGNTAQTLLNEGAGLVEHCEAGSDGIELSWVLSRRPAAQGPLEIGLGMEGMSCAGTSEEWIHLADATGTPRVRVGKAVAVDAAGHRFEAAIVTNNQSLCIRVSAGDLARAVYPLAVDPLVSPEFGMDEPVRVPQQGEHQIPEVAWNGTNWLVVWTEWHVFESPVDVVAARISAEGVVLDPFGILISPGEVFPASPAVASNGKDYFVVWGHSGFVTALDIQGARVTADGLVSPVVINDLPNDQFNPAVAGDVEGYLVVWKDRRDGGSSDIYGTRVSNQGVVLDGQGFPISTAPAEQSHPSVARGPGGFLVVWDDYRNFSSNGADIFGTRLDTNGTVLDPGGIQISAAPGDQVFPRVAANSNSYMVVWQDYRNSTVDSPQTHIYGTLVTPGGEVSHPQGLVVSVEPGSQALPGVATRAESSEEFLVVWNDGRPVQPGIYTARISGAGVVLDPEGVLVDSTPMAFTPAVAASDKGFLVVWNRTSTPTGGFGSAVVGARLDEQAGLIDSEPILITAGDSAENSPAVASNGKNWLVVWYDTRNYRENLYGVRIDYDGTVLDLAAIPISTGSGYKRTPAVASAGGDYLVVWTDTLDVHAARVGGDGTVLDPAGIAICTVPGLQIRPVVAADGTNYLVVWQGDGGIRAARVDREGVLLDPSSFSITSEPRTGAPALSFNGSEFLVAWTQWQGISGTSNDVWGARVGVGGVVLDPSGIPISLAPFAQTTPAVASAGNQFLVVWADKRNSTKTNSTSEIYGARVDAGGRALDLDGFRITTDSLFGVPTLASAGIDFLAVWGSYDSPDGPIRAARITSAGTVLFTDLLVNASAAHPAIAAGPGNSFLVVSHGERNRASRVVGNLLSFADAPVLRPVTITAGVATLSWSAQAGKTYRAQFKSDLNDTDWVDLDPLVTATNSVGSLLDATIGQTTQRFYRVLQLP